MKTPVKITPSKRFQKDLHFSPHQGAVVNKHLNLVPLLRIISVSSLNFNRKLVQFAVKTFRNISTCNFFFASIIVNESSSEIIQEPINSYYTKELRSLELTLLLVQVNRTFINR